MNRHLEFAKENGWAQLVPRVIAGAHRRLRDAITARKVGAPNFRVGQHPRLLGLGHMRIGRNFSAGDQLWLEAAVAYREHRYKPELVIGDDVSLSDGVHIACLRRITIGSGLLAGCGVLISDHAHGCYSGSGQSDPETMPVLRPLSSGGEVHIGRNVWLGDAVVVLAGAVIGDGAVIGANSVVSGTIPANTIAAGTPARVLKQWNAARREWMRVDGRENKIS
jgi:acetyltransferase-like isoleucine patch superfamily enzyme